MKLNMDDVIMWVEAQIKLKHLDELPEEYDHSDKIEERERERQKYIDAMSPCNTKGMKEINKLTAEIRDLEEKRKPIKEKNKDKKKKERELLENVIKSVEDKVK